MGKFIDSTKRSCPVLSLTGFALVLVASRRGGGLEGFGRGGGVGGGWGVEGVWG